MTSIDSYIVSFLNGTMDIEEYAVLQRWLKEKPENKDYFREYVLLWKATSIELNKDNFDAEGAFRKFETSSRVSGQNHFYLNKTLVKIFVAASVSILCVVSSFLFFWRSGSDVKDIRQYIVEVPAGARSKVTFPDGSVAWLNSESSIEYDSDFAKDSRNVRLQGEGYFEVSKNKNKPFIVKTEKLDVEVLGTKFNLRSYSEDPVVKVTLKEGSVKLAHFMEGTAPVLLKPNDQFTFRKSDNTMQVDSVDASEIEGWRDGSLVFNKVPLGEITKQLKRQYNIPIQIENDQLKDIVYYSDFKGQVTVKKVLEILSSGNKFRYEIKPDYIRIYN